MLPPNSGCSGCAQASLLHEDPACAPAAVQASREIDPGRRCGVDQSEATLDKFPGQVTYPRILQVKKKGSSLKGFGKFS